MSYEQFDDLFRYLVPRERAFPTVRTFLGPRRYARSTVATLDDYFQPLTEKELSKNCPDSHRPSVYR